MLSAQASEGDYSLIEVRRLEIADLGYVASVHMKAFPSSALTKLGEEAVRRYYAWQLTGPHESICLGAFLDDKLVGYCFAGVFRGALSGFLRMNRGYLIYRVLTQPWLMLNPLFRGRLAQARKLLIRPMTKASPPSPAIDHQEPRVGNSSFGVLSIAVSPNTRERGVGRLLMLEAERYAIQRGFGRMALTVDPKNTTAIGFYNRLGWHKDPTSPPEHGGMYKLLVPPSAPQP